MTEETLEKCKREDREAQRVLFETHAPRSLAVCFRYLGKREAEEALTDSYVRVFDELKSWKFSELRDEIKRVVVEEALRRVSHRPEMKKPVLFEKQTAEPDCSQTSSSLLLEVLSELPLGPRVVYNLRALEDWKTEEVAQSLKISPELAEEHYVAAQNLLRTACLKSL